MKTTLKNGLAGSLVAAAAAIVVVSLTGGRASAQAGTSAPPAYTPPRTLDGQPDLQGIWKAHTRANYDLLTHNASFNVAPGPSVVEGRELPYQPWAAAKQKENFANRATADPLGKCYRPGVPRITYLDFPFQIFQTPTYVAILYEWQHIYRVIYTDGRKHWDGIQFWMGDSRGHWEGSTLVVDVTDQNDQTWFDMAGNFHSEALHVVERYIPVNRDTMRYEVTVEDPKVFTRPWKMSMTLGRDPYGAGRLLEYECEAEAEEVSGDFTPLPTWYPGPGKTGTLPMTRPYADISRPAVTPPTVTATPQAPIPRGADGKPILMGSFGGSGQSGSWGLEEHAPRFGFPGGPSLVIDPPDKKLPWTAWGRTEKERRLQVENAHGDPTAHCFVGGIPRTMYVLGGPLHVIQTPGYIAMLFDRWSFRIIPTDGRPHLPDNVRLWMGDSVAHWDGDTLVIDTANLNGKSWLGETGDVISHGAHVVERLTMVDGNKIVSHITVDDPYVYTKPWTIAVNYTRGRAGQDDTYLEEACLEGNQAFKLMKGAAEKAKAQGQSPESKR